MSKVLNSAATAALVLLSGAAVAQTQPGMGQHGMGQMAGPDQGGMPMMDRHQGGMMQRHGDMMGREGRHAMGPHMMLMMFAMVDADGSGALSLDEIQDVHARMFRYADADGDGALTLEEMQSFMQGGVAPAAR